jgi:5'-phosphate synthase pdxT subunit
MKQVGILSLQGCVTPHFPHLQAAGVCPFEVKLPEDFERADAFILPGGESTTMWKLIDVFNLENIMREHFAKKPVWGICAGSILMGHQVLGKHKDQRTFDLVPCVDVERNAYGRQLDSHFASFPEYDNYEVTFIRAPILKINTHPCPNLKVLASHQGEGVWMEYRKGPSSPYYMMTTFHPELNRNYPSPMHKLFLSHI